MFDWRSAFYHYWHDKFYRFDTIHCYVENVTAYGRPLTGNLPFTYPVVHSYRFDLDWLRATPKGSYFDFFSGFYRYLNPTDSFFNMSSAKISQLGYYFLLSSPVTIFW